jgi:hypothetical protein
MTEQFKKLEATELYCNKCKTAVPVREKLLLVLPGQNLFEYVCSNCGTSLGKKTEADPYNMNIGMINRNRTSRR